MLFLAGVTGDVDLFQALIHDFRALFVQVVDDAVDHALVARDGARGDDHGIVGADRDFVELPRRHARQRAHRLALRARGDDDDLPVKEILGLFHIDEGALGDGDLPDLGSRLNDVEHTPSRERHLAAVLDGDVHDLLQSVDVGGERRNDDAPVRVFCKDVLERRADDLLAHRVPGALDVGGLAEIEKHALFAVFGDLFQIDGLARHGRQVDLEVAAMKDDPVRRLDRKRHRPRDGVIDVDEIDGERPRLDAVVRRDGAFRDVVHAVFAQFVVDERKRQLGAVEGRPGQQLLHEIGNAADMIFVSVRQKDAADLLAVVDEIGDVGKDEVDPRHLFGREDDACVNDDDVAAVLDGGHILADLADAAEEEHFDGLLSFAALRLLFALLARFSRLLCFGREFCGKGLPTCRFRGGRGGRGAPVGLGEPRPLSLCARTAAGLESRLLHRLLGARLARILFGALFAVVCFDAVENGKFDGGIGVPSLAVLFLFQTITPFTSHNCPVRDKICSETPSKEPIAQLFVFGSAVRGRAVPLLLRRRAGLLLCAADAVPSSRGNKRPRPRLGSERGAAPCPRAGTNVRAVLKLFYTKTRQK